MKSFILTVCCFVILTGCVVQSPTSKEQFDIATSACNTFSGVDVVKSYADGDIHVKCKNEYLIVIKGNNHIVIKGTH